MHRNTQMRKQISDGHYVAQDSSKAMLMTTAKRLSELVCGASIGELASLEHIMTELAVSSMHAKCSYIPVFGG